MSTIADGVGVFEAHEEEVLNSKSTLTSWREEVSGSAALQLRTDKSLVQEVLPRAKAASVAHSKGRRWGRSKPLKADSKEAEVAALARSHDEPATKAAEEAEAKAANEKDEADRDAEATQKAEADVRPNRGLRQMQRPPQRLRQM